MADITIPHFDMPFRLSPIHVAVTEQDTLEDVTNCVECIIRTDLGDRPELPDFGIENMVFEVQPIPLTDTITSIAQQEPRVATAWEQEPDAADTLIADIIVKVAQVEVLS
jgi:phage baseplate assembly protein W